MNELFFFSSSLIGNDSSSRMFRDNAIELTLINLDGYVYKFEPPSTYSRVFLQ